MVHRGVIAAGRLRLARKNHTFCSPARERREGMSETIGVAAGDTLSFVARSGWSGIPALPRRATSLSKLQRIRRGVIDPG